MKLRLYVECGMSCAVFWYTFEGKNWQLTPIPRQYIALINFIIFFFQYCYYLFFFINFFFVSISNFFFFCISISNLNIYIYMCYKLNHILILYNI